METLKSGFGWSDKELYDHFCYDVQMRYALGYRDLGEGHFELRTLYNFRQRVTKHMQEAGENLIEKAFEQITDEQIAAFELKTDKLRMDSTMVEQIQSAICGRKPSEEKLRLDDFEWEINADGEPQTVTCPNGQQAEVTAGRKEHRYRAAFEAAGCESCPFLNQCRTEPLKRTSERVLRFSQQDVNVALRRQRSADTRASGQNLRAAVEATVRSLKHPFGNGKVPVRGKPCISMVVIGSVAMSNVRRIHRYLVERKGIRKAENTDQKEAGRSQEALVDSPFASFFARLRSLFRSVHLLQPALAYGA